MRGCFNPSTGMAYTFKKVAHNISIGKSLFDEPGSHHVLAILEQARALGMGRLYWLCMGHTFFITSFVYFLESGVQIHLPDDHVIADAFSADAHIGVTDDVTGIPGIPDLETVIEPSKYRMLILSGFISFFFFSVFFHRCLVGSRYRTKVSCSLFRGDCPSQGVLIRLLYIKIQSKWSSLTELYISWLGCPTDCSLEWSDGCVWERTICCRYSVRYDWYGVGHKTRV